MPDLIQDTAIYKDKYTENSYVYDVMKVASTKVSGDSTSSSSEIDPDQLSKKKEDPYRITKSEYTTEVYNNDKGDLTIIIRDPRSPLHVVREKYIESTGTTETIEYDDPRGEIVATYMGKELSKDINLTFERATEYRNQRTRIISSGMRSYKEDYDHKEPYFFIVWGKMILVLIDADIFPQDPGFKTFKDMPEFLYESIFTIKTAFENSQCEIVFTTSHRDEATVDLGKRASYEINLKEAVQELKDLNLLTEEEIAKLEEVMKTPDLNDDGELHTVICEARKKWEDRNKLQKAFDKIEKLMLDETNRLTRTVSGTYANSTYYLTACTFQLVAPLYTSPKNTVVR